MKDNSRTKLALMNASISTVVYIGNIVLKFITRSIFIYFLGKEYLGVNGLFSSVISVLSLAELGIGSSIVYSLYRPLAENNHAQVKTLMALFRKVYNLIGFTVAIIGVILLPFLHYMINNPQGIKNVTSIYLLFLANSVVSYFFTYNRSLLSADQKNYVVILNDFVFSIVIFLCQVGILLLTRNFLLYLLVQIFGTILGNIRLSKLVSKEYSDLKEFEIISLEPETISMLKKNTFGNFLGKLGSVIVTSTDNILISSFVSLVAVGIYSNYLLVITSVQTLAIQIVTSVTASIGNVGVSGDKENELEIFRKHNFVNFTIVFFSSVLLMLCLNPFIRLWVGRSFELSFSIVILIVLNYIVKGYRVSGWSFIDAYGLAWYVKLKPLIEIVVNIVMTLLLLFVFKFGISGVLLGTLFSALTVVGWWEPYAIFKYGLKQPFHIFGEIVGKHTLSLLTTVPFIALVLKFSPKGTLTALIFNLFFGILISSVIYILYFSKTQEFIFVYTTSRKLFSSIVKKFSKK